MPRSDRLMCLGIVALACAGSLAPAAAPALDKDAAALIAEELTICKTALEESGIAVSNTFLRSDDARLGQWEQRYLQALNRSGMKKADKLAALAATLARVKRYEALNQAAFAAGQGLHVSVLDAQFRRLEVELAIARTRAE